MAHISKAITVALSSKVTMSSNNTRCQSCSLKMNDDLLGGGTEVDGSRSKLYCSRCFEDGQFTRPDFSMKEMQQLVKERMLAAGVPNLVAVMAIKAIPNLARWKK